MNKIDKENAEIDSYNRKVEIENQAWDKVIDSVGVLITSLNELRGVNKNGN